MSTTTPLTASLKPISPFLARAKELQVAEPIVSYWCTYYALQQALSLGLKDSESQSFLLELMDKLEATKSELGNNDAITDDLAASSYIDNFASKLFGQADDEDRAGKSNRLTAKKFLAAANFHEVLSTFGTLSTENVEKIKYAKWKASDIAKAIREGRKPTPGPAGGLPEDQDELPSTAAEVTPDEAKELSKELAELGTSDERSNDVLETSDQDHSNRSAVNSSTNLDPTSAEPESYPFPQHPTTPLPSAPPTSLLNELDESTTTSNSIDSQTAATTFEETPNETNPLNSIPDLNASTPYIPPTHQTSTLPPPPPAMSSSTSPQPPIVPNISSSTSTSAHAQPNSSGFASAVFPSAPPIIPQQSTVSQQPPLPPITTTTPNSAIFIDQLDPMTITQIQKHAKWAISALNYDDLETARKELRIALGMLGG